MDKDEQGDMDVQSSFFRCDEDDEWLFASTTRYDSLHMFELLHPVKAMDWVETKYLGIGTTDTFGGNEVLMLGAPERLLTVDAEEEGLAEERDFHLCAGVLHELPLLSAQFVNGTRLLLASEGGGSGNVISWHLPEVREHDTDVIRKAKTFSGLFQSTQPAQFCVDPFKNLIQGALLSQVTIQHLDGACAELLVASEHAGSLAAEPLARILSVASDAVALCCARSAGAVLVDTRSRAPVLHLKESGGGRSAHGETWATCGNGVHYVSASTAGRLVAYDTRKSAAASGEALAHCETGRAWGGRMHQCRDLCIQMSPHDGDTFSISGVDGMVRLYSMNAMPSCNSQPLKPVFEHDGHRMMNSSPMPTILNHMWHPAIANMITSSDSDGGLQCWKYKI